MRTSIPALVLALTLPVSMITNATIFGDDSKRKQISTAEYPVARQVGLMTRPGEKDILGTIWLSGECEATGAYHSAFFKLRDPTTGQVVTTRGKKGVELELHINLVTGAPSNLANFNHHVIAKVASFGTYVAGDTSGIFQDFVHFKLPASACLGKSLGFMNVRPKKEAGDHYVPTGELMTVGFHQDRAQTAGVTIEIGCRARDPSLGVGGYAVDCSGMPMASGTPVLEKQSTGDWVVVGMMKAFTLQRVDRYRPEVANWMVLSDVFADSLRETKDTNASPSPKKVSPVN